MADTLVASALQIKRWQSDYWTDYVRANRFAPYMGGDENAGIQLVDDLTRMKGNRMVLQLVRKLSGDGVSGNTTLIGNTESVDQFGFEIPVTTLRNGTQYTGEEAQKTNIELAEASKILLKNWSNEKLRDDLITSYMSIGTDNVPYFTASEAQKDAWLVANSDRVLAGELLSNTSSGDHSTSLSLIDNTDDKLSTNIISLARQMAEDTTTTAPMRPIRVNDAEEWWVLFANSRAYRDLKASAEFSTAVREGWTRGSDNPLFMDGDLIWDGVIIRKIPEIPVIPDVGAGGTVDVAPNFLIGAQSAAIAWALKPKLVSEIWDAEFRHVVGIEENRGVRKTFFNNKQHGVVTIYTAAEPSP